MDMNSQCLAWRASVYYSATFHQLLEGESINYLFMYRKL